MIPARTEAVRPFDLIRWARKQASIEHELPDGSPTRLKPIESHLLLVLATYCDGEATCWPSVRTLALDCGLKPYRDGRNAAVSAALARLRELQLVWTKQGGHGRSARRELLFNPGAQPHATAEGTLQKPHAVTGGRTPQPHADAGGSANNTVGQPHATACVQPHATTDPKYQRKGKKKRPKQQRPESLTSPREASRPAGNEARNSELHTLPLGAGLPGGLSTEDAKRIAAEHSESIR
jgi:hypothetical protein